MKKYSLQETAQALVSSGKGILAADQPEWHVAERLLQQGVTADKDTYRDWCDLLFSTPNLSDHVTGIILASDAPELRTRAGDTMVKTIISKNMIAGISPSTGLVPLAGAPGEVIGSGLDGLRERFRHYASLGIRFSKWRTAIRIGEDTPSSYCIAANAYVLAQFAALSRPYCRT